MRRIPNVLGLVVVALVLPGCASVSWPKLPSMGLNLPYRADVVQGNVVTRELLSMVRPGMTRLQVREILGTPLITDPFHAERWDYAFTIRRQGTEPQLRSIVLTFDGDALKSIEAPDLPGEKDFVASITRERRTGKEPVLELTEAQRQALPPPPAKPKPLAEQPSGPVRKYPPLEGS